jgi:hypothetical protein
MVTKKKKKKEFSTHNQIMQEREKERGDTKNILFYCRYKRGKRKLMFKHQI